MPGLRPTRWAKPARLRYSWGFLLGAVIVVPFLVLSPGGWARTLPPAPTPRAPLLGGRGRRRFQLWPSFTLPFPTSITLLGLTRIVKWFWVDFSGVSASLIFGPLPSCSLLRPCLCLWLLILGVSGRCWRSRRVRFPILTCGYCIKGLQDVSNFVIIKV